MSGGTSNSFVKLESEIQTAINNQNVKLSCKVATNTPGNLSTDYRDGDIIDGIELSVGDRILIKDQVDNSENGIYIVQMGLPPIRSDDMNDIRYTYFRGNGKGCTRY